MSKKVLNTIILDDNPDFREFLRGLLSRFSFIKLIASADSAREVLGVLEKEKPDLIITDIRMPGMGGMELAGVVKDRFPGIEVILMTLYDEDRYRVEAGRLGFPYIPKSSLLEELPLLLKKLVEKMEDRSVN
jgi:YesN/AraC family two-component response regulator